MKKLYKTLLATILLSGFSLNTNAQGLSYEWGSNFGGGLADVGKYLTTDNDGNVILVSEFRSSYDADPGTNTANLTSAGDRDVSIVKLDPDGNLIWARSIGGNAADLPEGLAVDSDNNIFVSGQFGGTADFDPGTGVENRVSAGGQDIFLLKLDANGDFDWVFTTGSNLGETARGIAVNNNDEIIMTGYFRGTVDFDPGLGTNNLTSAGGAADIFILKLDNAGNFISTYQLAGPGDQDGFDVVTDNLDNIYVTGYFQQSTEFNPNGPSTIVTSEGGNDIFVLKISPSNNFVWVRVFGGTSNEFGSTLAVDSDLNVILGGYYAGTLDFDPDPVDTDINISEGSNDLLIAKFDSSGEYLFGVSAGGINEDFVQDVAVDEQGNIFATGVMRNTVDFDPSANTQDVTVTGNSIFADQFFWKLDSNGNYLFAENVGGAANDHGFVVHCDGPNLYTVGYINGTADLDLTSANDDYTSNGSSDITISKHINCNPVSTNDVIVSCSPITWIDGNTYSADNNTATMMLTSEFGCDSLVTLDFKLVDIADQSVTPSATSFCDEGTPTLDLGSSEAGVFYSLIDQSNGDVLDGPTEGTGNALSLDGGTISTTTTYEVLAETNKNNALAFSGNSMTPSFVNLGNELTDMFKGKNQITVEAWINTSSTNNLQTVVSNYTNLGNTMQFLLRLDNDGNSSKVGFWIGTGQNPADYIQVLGTSTINVDTWYHIAGTYDGTNLKVYVNGVEENSINVTTNFPYIEAETKIGGGLSNNTEFFEGDITGVRIWDIARSETEIDTDKDQCIAGNTNGLVAMYNMIDGAGSSTLTDESVNGFNGTLTNMVANTAWIYNDLPTITCFECQSIMSQTPTVEINNSTTGTDTQVACDEFTWIDGNTYNASNNTAQFTLPNAAGCDSIVTLDLTIETSPTAGAQDNGDGTISATGTGDYQWIDCETNAPISGETSADFTPSENGDYAVIVTNGDCADTSDCVVFDFLGLTQSEKSWIAAYPNPTSGEFTITNGNGSITKVVVFDAAGRMINQKQVEQSSTVLNLSTVQNGVYFVHVYDEQERVSIVKVIKQ
jgi:hypothetical protein